MSVAVMFEGGGMELTTTQDAQDLERLETVIQKNARAFYEVGHALAEIRDRQLYKVKKGGEYKTFEAYCKGAWDMTKVHAYRLMGSCEAVDTVKSNPLGYIPENERQARPLTGLKPEQQLVAWQKAIDAAPEGKVTGAIVTKIVKEMITKSYERPVPKATGTMATEAMQFAGMAISQLERMRDDDPRREEALTRVSKWIAANIIIKKKKGEKP